MTTCGIYILWDNQDVSKFIYNYKKGGGEPMVMGLYFSKPAEYRGTVCIKSNQYNGECSLEASVTFSTYAMAAVVHTLYRAHSRRTAEKQETKMNNDVVAV